MLSPSGNAEGFVSNIGTSTDFSSGKYNQTGNPLDLAISGNGYFTVRSEAETLYTRLGQFHRDESGRLITPQGFALQANGRDLILKGDAFSVSGDGTVIQAGEPVGKLSIVDFADTRNATYADAGMFRADDGAVTAVDQPSVRQGQLEASNVSTGDEMVSIMEALRRAESGQRLVGVYDELMGRVLTTFGQV